MENYTFGAPDTNTLRDCEALLELASAGCGVELSWVIFPNSTHKCIFARSGFDGITDSLAGSSISDHAANCTERFAITDASLDSRFNGCSVVDGTPGIRFFAGVPIRDGQQVRLGTLCVADRAAITLNASQCRILELAANTLARLLVTSDATQHAATLSQALFRTQTMLNRTGAMAGVGGWEVDLIQNTIFWSDETCRIHGVEPGYTPILNEAIEFYAPEARHLIEAAVAKGMATGKPWDLELPFIRKDGSRIWVRAMGTAEFDQGQPVRLVGAFQDITERHNAKIALVSSESQFRGSFESASHGIALVATHGQFLKVNKSLCDMLGFSEAELLSLDFQSITHPDDLALDLRHMGDLLDGRVETYEMEKRYIHKNGATIWVLLSVSLVRAPDGFPVNFVSQIQNITDRHLLTERLKTLLATASDGIHILDCDGNVVEFSQSFADMLGYSNDEAANLNVRDWDVMIAPDALVPNVRNLIHEPRSFETRHRRKDGSVFDVEINAKGVILDGMDFLYASSRDITARKQAEQALRDGRIFTQDILDSVTSEIAVVNQTGLIVATNEAWRQFALDNGCLTDANLGIGANYFDVLKGASEEADQSAVILEVIESVIDGRLPKFSCEYPCHSPEKQRWFTLTVTPMHTGERGAVMVHTDITSRKETEELMRNLAFHDSLTQLANRRLLQERLNLAMASNRRSGQFGALLVLDLDNFKPLNDNFGHAVGDLLLKEVAARLIACVREVDTVARIGGDEFIVALSSLSEDASESEKQALRIAEKIRVQLAQPYTFSVPQDLGETTILHHCSSSIGGALFSPAESNQVDIFRRADAAMYLAKESGRNTVRFADNPETG